MSRAKASAVYQKSVNSSATQKQASLNWKERIHPEDYENLRLTFELFD